MSKTLWLTAAVALALVGCSSGQANPGNGSPPGGGPDAGSRNAGGNDAGESTAGTDAGSNPGNTDSGIAQNGSDAGQTGNGTDPIFIGAGDISGCGAGTDGADTAQLLSTVFANGAHPDGVVFTTGDNAYNGGLLSEYMTCYDPTWGKFKSRTRPSAGNHEWDSGGQGYFDYYGAQTGGSVSQGAYYSYELGAWHIIVLDSFGTSMSAGSAQELWLKADLAAHASAKCTLAYMHAPRFSSGSQHGNSDWEQDVWQDLYDGNVDVVLAGHDHEYERFARLDAAGNPDSARGMRSFVVGTGGNTLYTFGTPLATSEVRDNSSYGLLSFTLHPTSYDWLFLPTSGTFTDTGSEPCH